MRTKIREVIRLHNIKPYVYLISISSVVILFLFNNYSENDVRDTEQIVNYLSSITSIPNTVTSVILGTRLFDTMGEVTVFTIAGLGVKILLSHEESVVNLSGVKDKAIIKLLDISALLCFFIAVDLAIKGHLTPGGGFASGVSAATAITLLMITGRMSSLEKIYNKYNVPAIEKVAVIVFLIVALLSFTTLIQSDLNIFNMPQDLLIPLLNIICALKVTFGTWSIIRLFIIKRGLLN